MTLLFGALIFEFDCTQMLELLLEKGADPKITEDKYRKNSIFLAQEILKSGVGTEEAKTALRLFRKYGYI